MSFWSKLKGAAGWLLPILLPKGLEEYRKKNPKSGWLIDAIEGIITSIDMDPSLAHLTPDKKVLVAAKQVEEAFPGTSKEEAKHIARLVLTKRQVKNT